MAAENHIIDYDESVKNLSATLKKHVGIMGDVVQKYNDWVLPKLPSEYINQLNQVNTANEKIIASNKKVVDATKSVNESVQKGLTTGASLYKQKQAELAKAAKAEKKAADDAIKESERIIKQKQKEANDYTAATRKKIQDSLDFKAAMEKQKQAELAAAKQTEISAQKESALQERKRIALERATAKALEQSRAYVKLQNSWRQAQKALQDSIVTDGHKAQSTKRLQREFDVLDKKIKQVDAATKNYSKNVGNYQSAFGGLGSLTSQLAGALGWAGALYTAVNIGKDIYQTTKQLDVLNKSMQLGSKDAESYGSNMAFLNRITEQYGLELITTSQAYNKFYIAAKNKLALEDIQLIFDKVSKSASLMGLTVYDQEGIFKALEQMMSKGTVQAEELRGQLGDRLPGAFEIMAKAMNVSTAELGEMMKDGKVMAADVLPKFAIELEKAFGADKVGRVENLTAAENRMKNAWTEFVKGLNSGNGVISVTITKLMQLATGFIESATASDKLSDSLLEEQLALNDLINRITSTNISNSERIALIEKLKTTYPDFIGMIENEDFSNQNLRKTLALVNDEYRNRILLQTQAENVTDAEIKRNKKMSDAASAQISLYKRLNELNVKYNLGVDLTPENAMEKVNEITNKRNDIRGFSGINAAGLKGMVAVVKTYRDEAEKLNEEVEKERKIRDEIHKSIGGITEEQRKGIQNNKVYNAQLKEQLKEAEKLGGRVNKDYSEFDLASIKKFIQSKSSIEGESEKERKKREAAERKAAKEQLKSSKELLQAEYAAAKSKLELEKANAVLQDDKHAKEIQLATLERDHKLKMVNLEVKDKATATQQKIAIENEYATTIKGITDKMSDDYGDEFSEEYKKIEEGYNAITKAVEGTQEAITKLGSDLANENERFEREKDILELRKELESINQGTPEYYSKLLQIREAEHKYDKAHLEYLIATEKDPVKKLELQNSLKALEITFDTDKLKIAKEALSSFESSLSEIFSNAGFEEVANLLDGSFLNSIDNIKDWKDAAAAAMEAVSAISAEVFAKMKADSDAYYETEFNRLEKEKDMAIKYAGENKAGQEAIEEQYNARRLQLKRQQAKQDKDMALFQAFINIAQGVTAALAQGGPAGFVLAALVGALGAVQIASIASRPLPEFYKGTQNAPEGWAIVDELRPEVHTDKHGNLKSTGSTGGANLRYLEKGDKIFKSHSDFFREMSGSYVDRNGSIHIENNGISANEMDAILGKHLGSEGPIQQTVIDENGFNRFIINGQSRTRIKNRLSKFRK